MTTNHHAHGERRLAKRVAFHSKNGGVSLSRAPSHKGQGIGEDLSISGMRLLCTEALQQDEKLTLGFMLPWDLGRIDCEAKVQWVKKDHVNYAVGVQFLKLHGDQLKSIRRYIVESEASSKKSFLVRFFSLLKR